MVIIKLIITFLTLLPHLVSTYLPTSGIITVCTGESARGGAVVEALRYKLECRGIDSRLCHWNFLLA
jgi:hypothetical protein